MIRSEKESPLNNDPVAVDETARVSPETVMEEEMYSFRPINTDNDADSDSTLIQTVESGESTRVSPETVMEVDRHLNSDHSTYWQRIATAIAPRYCANVDNMDNYEWEPAQKKVCSKTTALDYRCF